MDHISLLDVCGIKRREEEKKQTLLHKNEKRKMFLCLNCKYADCIFIRRRLLDRKEFASFRISHLLWKRLLSKKWNYITHYTG